MNYISKGAVLRPGTEEILYVSRCGSEYALSKPMSTLWLEGRFRVSETRSEVEEIKLKRLMNIGLVEPAESTGELDTYRALTRCVILPAKLKLMPRWLKPHEKQLWAWISQSGMHLTMAELVFLVDNHVQPEPQLLGPSNLQNLTERIYASCPVHDRLLEVEMETSAYRDNAVNTVLGLLRKKHLLLV